MHSEDRPKADHSHEDSIINALARETGGEPAYVKTLYEREFAHLKSTATVHGFLSLIAYGNVRKVLRQSSNPRSVP